MSLILCLETSTKNCSVAVVGEGKILSLVEDGSDGYTHAEKLNGFIERAMAEAKLGFADLQGVAVSEGPGSYTGLRIGVSAAKGLAYALGIRLIGINPLEAMARSVNRSKRDNLLIPMIDARRMEVFCAGFSGKDETVFKTRAEIVDTDSFPESKSFEEVCFFGDGAVKCRELLEPRGFIFLPEVQASARGMAALAAKKYSNEAFEDVAYFEPFYLKDFVAGKKKKPAN